MTFDDLVEKVKDVAPNPIYICSYDSDIIREFNLENFEIEERDSDRLFTRVVCSWMCTDQLVGLDVVYLDDEPVGIAFKQFRKADTKYFWKDDGSMFRVFEYLISLIQKPEIPNVRTVNDKIVDDILGWVDTYEYKDFYKTVI